VLLQLVDTSSGLTLSVTNCHFFRPVNTIEGDTVSFRDNSCYGGSTSFYPATGQTYTVTDNLFDQTTMYNLTNGTWTLGWNGYVSGYSRLIPDSANDVVLSSSPAYQSGALGNWYLPTGIALTNAGSVTAAAAGLYHYTVLTSQAKEGANTVSIGFHYVAVDGYGNAIDTDGDGWADVFEDRNGNGTVDSGESDWQRASDLGLNVLITQPRANSLIP
jgi:hypothetical protein